MNTDWAVFYIGGTAGVIEKENAIMKDAGKMVDKNAKSHTNHCSKTQTHMQLQLHLDGLSDKKTLTEQYRQKLMSFVLTT